MGIEESQWVVTGAALMANMNHDRLNSFLPSLILHSFIHNENPPTFEWELQPQIQKLGTFPTPHLDK